MLFCWLSLFVLLTYQVVTEAAGATEQHGSVSLGTSSASSKSISVNFQTFPSAFNQNPTVYTWVRNGITGNGEFRTQVTESSTSGFSVTVTRYDAASGWDWSPTLEWEARIVTNEFSQVIPHSPTNYMDVRIHFPSQYPYVPTIYSWVRGEPMYPDTFSVSVKSVDSTGFDATVRRTDTSSSWAQSPTVYWTASPPPTITEDNMGFSVSGQKTMPPPKWVFTPAVSENAANVFDIMGRELHLSTVRQLLIENAPGKFPITQTTSNKMNLKVVIRGDTVYADVPSVEFQGLKSMQITARQLISNDATLVLSAPQVCASLDGNNCQFLTKASEMKDGGDGKPGVASPEFKIYLHAIKGNFFVRSEGSNGIAGAAGGDGEPGVDNTWTTASLTNAESCDKDCGDLFGELIYKGKPGPDGGHGKDARRGGDPGVGGDVGSVTIYTEEISGLLQVEKHPGTGGPPTEHGIRGRGGLGGQGGCGRQCRAWLMCIIIICWPECTRDEYCNARGDPGKTGNPGLDGFQQYAIPSRAPEGSIGSSSLSTVNSVKTFFQADTELLELIRRHGESLFQRNDNVQAEEIFSFLLSVTDESSTFHQEVELRVDMINEGFDYYGNSAVYAPDLDWSYLSERTESLLATGKAFEDAYNSVMNEVQNIQMVSQTVQSVVTLAITTNDRELANAEAELKSQKNLYVKALRQLERTMKSEMLQINVLVPAAIIHDKVMDTLPALIGGIAGFVQGLIFLNPVDAFQGAMQVMDVIFGRPECNAPTIQEAALTLQERLDFGYEFEKINPDELDFSTMDVSAVPIIMYSDLAKNKAWLVQELRCLYDNDDTVIIQNLERVIDDFYRDGALRINLIDQIMNMDIQLKEISYNRQVLAEAQAAVDEAVLAIDNSISVETKMEFTDLLLSMYQTQENIIMRALYELSKSYQFSCLWDFNALDKYVNYFSDEVMTNTLGSLEGIFQLQLIRQELEDERDVFLNLVASSAGPASHTFNSYWEFNRESHSEVITTLNTEGQFSFQINVDPNDVSTIGCESCYNGRLEALYIELLGETQDGHIPNTIYIKVSHMGDSYFVLPIGNGNNYLDLLQQTPENIDGGHVMSFDSSYPVTSTQDQALHNKFLKTEHSFCEDTNSFFVRKPCKSPYASYVVTVPRNDNLVCSLDPNDLVSGTNCQDLDFTKFHEVRVYAKINSWSDYPMKPEGFLMEKLIKEMKEERAAKEQL